MPKKKLFDSVVICNGIDNSKYRQILVSLKFSYDAFDIADISDDKITILIDTNIIRMTDDNLKYIYVRTIIIRYFIISVRA